MKKINLLFICFFLIIITIKTSAQNKDEILHILKSSEGCEELQNKISQFKKWTTEELSINSGNTPSAFDKKLLNHQAGDIIESDDHKAFIRYRKLTHHHLFGLVTFISTEVA